LGAFSRIIHHRSKGGILKPLKTYRKQVYWLKESEEDRLRKRLLEKGIRMRSAKGIVCTPLGEIDSATVPGIRFLTDPGPRGPERAPDNPRTHLIAITAMLQEGRLRFLWEYDPAFHHPDTIQTLAQATLDHLRTFLPETDDIPDDLLDEIDT
jgi:hypothetical protein